MPFKSRQQAKWMFATHPKMAKEWAEHTPSIQALPKTVARVKRRANLKQYKKK